MPGRRAPNEPLRQLLTAADWTYEGLARAVNALGAENGLALRYDRTAVAHWLAGSLPRQRTRGLVAEAFARRLGRPVAPADLGMGPSGPVLGDGGADSRGGAVDGLARLCGIDADPVRRPLLEHAPFSAAALEVPDWRQQEDGGVPPLPEPVRQDVRGVAEAVAFFCRVSDRGGRHGRTALVAYLEDDVVPRLHADGPAGAHPALLSEVARLVQLLAQMYVDDARQGAAQHYFRAALRLAVEAGDRFSYAVVLHGMSMQALELGHRTAAVRLAGNAVRAASPGASDSLRAALLAQSAVTLASAGEPRRAAEALEAAELHHERAGPQEPAPDSGRSPPCAGPSLGFQRGRVLAASGDRPAAIAALRRALDGLPAASCRKRALTYAEIARLLIREGALDEACDAWHRFLDEYAQLRSGRADRAWQEMRADLRAHRGHRPVRLLLQRADTLTRRGRR